MEKALVAEWEDFYRNIFGIKADFSNLQIPEKEPGFDRLIIMAAGMTSQRLYDKCGEMFHCLKWSIHSNDSVSERTNEKSAYVIWVREQIEADEELKNYSANRVKAESIKTETLSERLIHELKYFKKTGGHLDIKNISLCSGSRGSDDIVPGVRWYGGGLMVFWYGPGFASGDLRPRRVVS